MAKPKKTHGRARKAAQKSKPTKATRRKAPKKSATRAVEPPGALRLTFKYVGDEVKLVEQESVDMVVPTSDPVTGFKRERGFWAEVKGDLDRTLFRSVMHNPTRNDAEVFSDDQSISRAPALNRKGVFVVVVPETEKSRDLVLARSSGSSPHVDRRLRSIRSLATAPAKEIARIKLKSPRRISRKLAAKARGSSDDAVRGSVKIVDAGPNEKRWNVVIVSEGYRADEMGQFALDAQQFADLLLAAKPFDRLRAAINVFRVDVVSQESGARDPTKCGGNGAKPKTHFEASFCNDGIRRLLVAKNDRVIKVIKKQIPQWHMALLIVNSTVHGGSGGSVATFSKAPGATNIALHEMGHTAFGLADEYEYFSGCATDKGHDKHSSSEPSQANITTNKNRATTKWRNLILATTAVPTTQNADCKKCDPQLSPVPAGTIGLFEGADYFHCNVYRPEFDCRMRNLNKEFCGVCQEVIVRKLTPFLPV